MTLLRSILSPGLLRKEWKDNLGWLVGGFVFLFLSHLPPLIAELMRATGNMSDIIGRFRQPGLFLGEDYLALFYAAFLVGGDRARGAYDLVLSMPYHRRQIIASKFIVGLATVIIIFVLLGLLLMAAFLYHPLFEYQLYGADISRWVMRNILVSGLLFSFGFMVATLTGTVAAAAILSAISLFYPMSITRILVDWLGFIPLATRNWLLRFSQDISLVTYMNNMELVLARWLIVLLAGVVFFLLSMVFFERNPMERNGKVILFKKLEPLFVVAVAPMFLALMMWLFGFYPS